MKLFKALLIFWLSATAAAASAQRAEDSLAITDGPWKVLIDENGVVEKVWPKVKPDTNAAEILAALNGEA